MLRFFKVPKLATAASLDAVAHPDDRRILGLLAAQGDPLQPARHTRFYFYARKDDQDAAFERLADLGREALGLGFKVAEQRADAVILETEQSMAVDVVNAARALMEHWADSYRLEFDGWECRVARAG